MDRMIRCMVLLAMLFMGPLGLAHAQQRILGIDVNETGALIRLDGKTHYRIFSLETPARLVIDLKDASLEKKYMFRKTGTGPVLRVRSAPRNRHNQRIVLDLRHDVEFQTRDYSIARGQHEVAVQFHAASGQAATGARQAATPARPARAPKTAQRCHRPSPPGAFVVAVDAGHGGRDTGAIGPSGSREKDVTLDIAYRLHGLLAETPGVHSVLTRETDAFVRLRERARRAQACGADLLVSIHADAQHSPAVRGASVYVYPPRNRRGRQVRTVGALLRSGTLQSDTSLNFDAMPNLRTAHPSSVASHVAGHTILHELGRRVELLRSKVLNGRFTVLSSQVPSVLIETGFISHQREEAQLGDPQHQQRLAQAVYDGIHQYIQRYARPNRAPHSTLHVAGTL